MYDYQGWIHGYIFRGFSKSDELLFSDAFWYKNAPTVEELEQDLEEYCRAEISVYNYENCCNESVFGKIEPIELTELENEI